MKNQLSWLWQVPDFTPTYNILMGVMVGTTNEQVIHQDNATNIAKAPRIITPQRIRAPNKSPHVESGL